MNKPITTQDCCSISLTDILFCMAKYMHFYDITLTMTTNQRLESGAWLVLIIYNHDGQMFTFNGQWPESVKTRLIDWLKKENYLQ